MKVHLNCRICRKVHHVDLRLIEDRFTCDACGNVGQNFENSEIETVEKQILTGNKMGILSVIFIFSALFSLWLWLQAYDHDPRKGGSHETLFYVFLGMGLVALVCGVVSSVSHRKLYF